MVVAAKNLFCNINKKQPFKNSSGSLHFQASCGQMKLRRVFSHQVIGTAQSEACLLSALQYIVVADGF